MLSTKEQCIATLRVVKRDAASALVYDETGEVAGDIDAKRISF
jgi:hypothetical protein